MGLHQYVGARYTPKFYQNSLDPSSCEWEVNVTYGPLTIVTTSNTHCYISKKTVPDNIGSPASNPDYWLETGNFNAYIQALQDQIDIINNTDIPHLQDEIDALAGVKKFWYVGDSMLENAESWGSWLDTRFGTSGTHKTCEGGIGFSNPGNNTGYKLSQLIAADNNVPDDVTDVFVVAGVNDCHTTHTSTIQTDLVNALINIRTKAPGCKIYVIFNATLFNPGLSNYSDRIEALPQIFNAIRSKLNVESDTSFLEAPYYQLLFKDFLSDSVHPNSIGYRTFAGAIYKAYLGHPCNTRMSKLFHGISFEMCDTTGMITLRVKPASDIYNDSGTPLTIANNFVNLYTGESLPAYPRFSTQFYLYGNVSFTNSSNQTTVEPAVIQINQNGDTRIALCTRGQSLSNIVKIAAYFPISTTVPYVELIPAS